MTFESTAKIPLDLANLFCQFRLVGYKVKVYDDPDVHRSESADPFRQKIEVFGFGTFKGTSAISDNDALVNAGELLKKEFQDLTKEQFSFEKVSFDQLRKLFMSNLEINTSAKLQNLYKNQNINQLTDLDETFPTVCDLKWADVINAFNRINNSLKVKKEVIQKLIDRNKIRVVYTSREIVKKVDPDKKTRFKIFTEKFYVFTTKMHISDITICFSNAIEQISKDDTFDKAYSKLRKVSRLLNRTKNGIIKLERHSLSTEEIKNLLQDYIKKKIIEVVENKSKNENEKICIYFLNQSFVGPSDESFLKLFNYLKKIAYYTNDEVTIPCININQTNIPDSTLKAPFLSSGGSLNLITPPNTDLGIVLSRLDIIADLISNFISVYNSKDTPSQIVSKFLKLEQFTISEVKSRNFLYKMEHSQIGLFVGAGTTLANAKLHAHRQIFDILYLLVNLVVSVQELQKHSETPVIWLITFTKMNPLLVKFKQNHFANSDRPCLASFKIEALLISFEVKASSFPEMMRLVFNQIFILLESFYKRINDTVTIYIEEHVLHKEIISKTNLGNATCLSVPVVKNINNKDYMSSKNFTSKEKLMELVLRFKQIYSKMMKNDSIENKINIISELYKLNPSFFYITRSADSLGMDNVVVLVVLPLGSFSAKCNSLRESIFKVFLEVFNRLLLLVDILDELFQVNLSLVKHSEIEAINKKFNSHFWYSINKNDQKVILHLSHFSRIEAYNVKLLAAKLEAFKDLVKELRKFRVEAHLNIQIEDNKALNISKEKDALGSVSNGY